MIHIDGSQGGGQMVRTALGLSALTAQPFAMHNIRSARPKPGLKTQHLQCVKGVGQLVNADYEGAYEGSESLFFYPARIHPRTINITVNTAGATSLILQSVLVPALFAGRAFTIRVQGGTDVAWSPPFDYMQSVLLPYLQRFAELDLRLKKRGYFPRGGGKVELHVRPHFDACSSFGECMKDLLDRTLPFDLTRRGPAMAIKGVAHASSDLQDGKVTERMMRGARAELPRVHSPSIQEAYAHAESTGCGITLWALFESVPCGYPALVCGSDKLGERSMSAEEVGRHAGSQMVGLMDSKAVIDEHMADNIIPYLGLIGGSVCTSRITSHVRTNIAVTEKFLNVRFSIEQNTITAVRA